MNGACRAAARVGWAVEAATTPGYPQAAIRDFLTRGESSDRIATEKLSGYRRLGVFRECAGCRQREARAATAAASRLRV